METDQQHAEMKRRFGRSFLGFFDGSSAILAISKCIIQVIATKPLYPLLFRRFTSSRLCTQVKAAFVHVISHVAVPRAPGHRDGSERGGSGAAMEGLGGDQDRIRDIFR